MSAITEAAITDYITDTFEGVHPVDAWGYEFFFYNPDRTQPDKVYFATLANKDSENDHVSNLDRPGVFRLNIGVSTATFRSLFGGPVPQSDAAETAYDYTELDTILPHPEYALMNWICILNPGPATFLDVVQPLLAGAYERAVNKYHKRAPGKAGS